MTVTSFVRTLHTPPTPATNEARNLVRGVARYDTGTGPASTVIATSVLDRVFTTRRHFTDATMTVATTTAHSVMFLVTVESTAACIMYETPLGVPSFWFVRTSAC
jgi:hypothetical protein